MLRWSLDVKIDIQYATLSAQVVIGYQKNDIQYATLSAQVVVGCQN